MTNYIDYQVFGKGTRPTIYYIGGFNMKTKKLALHIWFLMLFKFRVVAFEIDPVVLTGGNPQLLISALNQVMETVTQDVPGRSIAGTYGISLGSFFALNVLTLPQVPKAFLNTGGGSIVQAVWEMPVLGEVRRAFEKNKITRSGLETLWNPVDISQNLERIAGKELVANASYADEYIPIADVLKHEREWKNKGINSKLILYKSLSHKALIMRTFLKLRMTRTFFNNT